MPISRDVRMDRRRRLLRDAVETDQPDDSSPRRGSRRAAPAEDPEAQLSKRKAGYSQDVRRPCGQRLVQFIPVRRRSYAAVVLVSFVIPALLLAAHYLVHVTGQLPWWRHPLAVALDIGHPRSIAAWLCSQLWLLCLVATVLTFQLRRHKLDDYKGEYRLWFWLVLTCLVASVDSTTSITELFALALDPWAQRQLGWSGPAVVDLTLAVLVGMLGLRMCSELKVVPISLLWWLGGLVVWGCSAALARPEFQLEMSAPVRYWLVSGCWLGGLTMIWLAALTYLRSIYTEAQQRFLLRGLLAISAPPLGQRLRQSLPSWPLLSRQRGADDSDESAKATPRTSSRWALPAIPTFLKRGASNPPAEAAVRGTARRTGKIDPESTSARESNPQAAAAIAKDRPANQRPVTQRADMSAAAAAQATDSDEASAAPPGATRRGLGGLLKRSRNAHEATADEATAPAARPPRRQTADDGDTPQKSRWSGWLRRPKDNDDAQEYRKVTADAETRAASHPTQSARPARPPRREDEVADQIPSTKSDRRWLPKLSRPKLRLPKLSRPKLKLPKFSRREAADDSQTEKQPANERRSLLSRLKLPKLGLSALKLQPPVEDASATQRSQHQPSAMRPVAAAPRPLPSTDSSPDQDDYFDDEDQDGRPLSKAERKRMRRTQQQQQQRRPA